MTLNEESKISATMIKFMQQHSKFSGQHRLMLLALLMLLVLLNLPSAGFVRYNGGGDDEGSGLGGTGRSAIPGSESGLGGTGFRPFLGYNNSAPDGTRTDIHKTSIDGAAEANPTQSDVVIYHHPADLSLAIGRSLALDIPATRPVDAAPIPSSREIIAESSYTRNSSAILISEQIQIEVDELALAFAALDQQVTSASVSALEMSSQTHGEDSEAVVIDAAENEATPKTGSENGSEVSWQALGNYLADQRASTANGRADSELAALSIDRDSELDQRTSRPDRVQRPELPAMQRVRPVQRAGVLPPRIQPLKL